MIIALSGRMGSGKSELGKICLTKGFEILKFADGLKDLICELINVDRNFIENNKEVISEYLVSFDLLAKKLNISEHILYSLRDSNKFSSIRDILQFIGTDVIRTYKPGWHIEILKNKIKQGVNYCIDDLRFKDELAFIESINGESWFILRPGNFNYSNHDSEIDLNWSYFGNRVIINDVSLKLLRNKWSKYLDTSLKDNFTPIFNCNSKVDLRNYLHKTIVLNNKSTSYLATKHGCSRDTIIYWCSKLLIPVKRNKYTSNNYAFLYPTIESSYYAGLITADGCIKKSGDSCSRYVLDFGSKDSSLVSEFKEFINSNRPVYYKNASGYKNSTTFYYSVIENPFIIENLKLWNLKPRKSCNECIPDLIKTHIDLLKQWIVGLIDGDGTIYTFNKSIGLTILSSKEVIYYIQSVIPIEGKLSRHKNTDLFEIKWYNHKVVAIKDWLQPKLGLKRKWDKVDEFKSFNTNTKSKSII